jgi:hypothetical protein
MSLDLEKAQLMYKLAVAKRNWGAKYDRLEHFKKFPNLDIIVKELVNKGWIIFHKKPQYNAISLDTKYKKEIIEFIESVLPNIKGNII